MGKKVTLGGDRIGSGNRTKQELHNFYRSNHNLSSVRATTMAPGVLYPVYVRPCTNGDVFDINTSAFMRTVPTIGPMYGSFKFQLDFYQLPVRLYQGILHNNPINIGLKMSEVKLPKIDVKTIFNVDLLNDEEKKHQLFTSQVHPSSLLKYCGISGVGRCVQTNTSHPIHRKFNAVPILGYYDIFKNYYSNKQEKKAYVISPISYLDDIAVITNFEIFGTDYNVEDRNGNYYATGGLLTDEPTLDVTITGQNLSTEKISIVHLGNWLTLLEAENAGYLQITDNTENSITFVYNTGIEEGEHVISLSVKTSNKFGTTDQLQLLSFNLENIDKMRETLLCKNQLGEEYVINDFEYLPYTTMTYIDAQGYNLNRYVHNGLCVKTYQSDLFNNWLDTEWIEGENGINAITSVATGNGSFTIDSLNLANKVYNMLNRIAISGGTYQDWQEAVYTDKVVKHVESPIYIGGMSSEIVFDEVVSTAASGDEELGTLAGRGNMTSRKGGHIKAKINEPSFIMAIASITPRIMYSQGNEFFMTDLDSVDDFHKPSLDGIGFQDLLVERMNFLGTPCAPNGTPLFREKAGKQTAWIEYQTDVDRCYGDFALTEGYAYMILNRNYSFTENGKPSDITTYIDPTKFNYAFANANLAAQNFWAFINIKNNARLLMSAKQIPNL